MVTSSLYLLPSSITMNHQFNDMDFKNDIFEYSDLTRIIGGPTTAALITLWNEVKANAQAVHTTLGGGEHGHLGLVCSSTTYATLVLGYNPYIKQPDLGQLIIKGEETQYQIVNEEKNMWKLSICSRNVSESNEHYSNK